MENPFLKRATEFFRDEEAFLSVLSPEPISYFLLQEGRRAHLYSKLVLIRGTPGSGKTTLARVFEFPTLMALRRNSASPVHRTLHDTMIRCGALDGDEPQVLACRLALETDYRDFWDFPYPDNVKVALTVALIQARAVLTWMRHLRTAGIPLERVELKPRADADAATASIGGVDGHSVVARARAVERALYKIVGALVAPDIGELPSDVTDAYKPFDVIESFVVASENGAIHELLPLVILDDAHILAPAQLAGVRRSLMRRELRVARWILTRLDVLHPHEAFEALTEERPTEGAELPGITLARDYVPILLQSGPEDRRKQRVAFRRMARDMAGRYLAQMPIFASRNLQGLESLLSDQVPALDERRMTALRGLADADQRKLKVSRARRESLEVAIEQYVKGSGPATEDVKLAMLRVLFHRMAKRGQLSLLARDADEGREPKVDVSVRDAAKIHLFHDFGRPFYIGFDDLCDASSENAEQFLRLAAQLVEASATNILREAGPSLDAASQHTLLMKKAEEVVRTWDFPQSKAVGRIAEVIADRCLRRSMERNASLGAGANAYGVLQEEFEAIPDRHPELARVLQAAVANNAITVVPSYSCKKKVWCLLELGGIVLLRYGLTLKRGGFLEGTALELANLAKGAG